MKAKSVSHKATRAQQTKQQESGTEGGRGEGRGMDGCACVRGNGRIAASVANTGEVAGTYKSLSCAVYVWKCVRPTMRKASTQGPWRVWRKSVMRTSWMDSS